MAFTFLLKSGAPILIASVLIGGSLSCDSASLLPDETTGDGGPSDTDTWVRVLGENTVQWEDAPSVIDRYPRDLPNELEPYDVGLLAFPEGTSPYIEIDVSSEVTGLALFVIGHEDADYIVSELNTPLGEQWVSSEGEGFSTAEENMSLGFPSQFFSPARVLASRGSATFFFPNSPDLHLDPGIYTMRLSAVRNEEKDERPASLVVARHWRDDIPDGGDIKVTFHFADGMLNAETAGSDPWFQEGLDTFKQIYEEVGLTFQEIGYVDVDVDAYEVLELEDEKCNGGALFDLFREHVVGEADRLHIVLIDRFQCLISGGVDIGQGMGGIAGGIPGTMFATGTAHHGVALSSHYLQDNPTRFGTVMAHEVGHYLGLFHVTERPLSGVRPIVDIIEDTTDDPEQAQDNLMHYLSDDGSALTEGQRSVVLRHPLVRRMGSAQ